MIRQWLSILAMGLLLGCSTMKLEDFAGTTPVFKPEEYFEGRTKAWGFFEDRFGTIRREFTVEIDGTVEGNTLTLDERFVYNDGERQTRVWTIVKKPDGTYEGRADDVVGIATGRAQGRALNWKYDFDLPMNGSTLRTRFDDWMFLNDDGVMINRTTISKFGIELGTVVIFFRKLDDEAASEASFAAAAE